MASAMNLSDLVSLACQRRRALSNRRERIARLLLAFGNGKSSVHRDVHGVSLLLTECVSQMAGKNARAAVVDGLGASNHEPRVFGRWQGVLERTRLSLRRRIPPAR